MRREQQPWRDVVRVAERYLARFRDPMTRALRDEIAQESAVLAWQWIGKLQDLGFKLSQISGLLSAVDQADKAPEAMEGVREIFDAKLAQTRDQLSRLKRLERDLEESLAYLEACRSCDEAASAQTVCTDCRSDRHVIPETSLVAGIHLRKENGTTTSEGSTGP